MPALYTITTRASGTILTAAIYNADHQNHVNNGDAQHLGGFSANTSQMRTQTSPGDVGSESLALSIADELARIRYMIALQRGTTFWYGTAAAGGAGWAANYVRNSNFLTGQRMGQATQVYPASAGAPYTFDQWYLFNSANQVASVAFGAPMASNDINSCFVQRQPGQTGVAQIWLGQPFTLAQIVPLRGKQVTISALVSTGAGFSGSQVQLALFSGTGTAGKLALGFTGQTAIASVPLTGGAAQPATRIQATGVIPSNASQLELMLAWVPVGTAIATDGFGVGQVKLELGAQATPYIPPDPYDELQELGAFYWKSFQLGVLPAQNVAQLGAIFTSQVVGASASQSALAIRWPTRMIKAPTVVTYNPSAANAQVRNTAIAADCSSTSIAFPDESGCDLVFTSAAGSAVGQSNAVQLTADAGL